MKITTPVRIGLRLSCSSRYSDEHWIEGVVESLGLAVAMGVVGRRESVTHPKTFNPPSERSALRTVASYQPTRSGGTVLEHRLLGEGDGYVVRSDTARWYDVCEILETVCDEEDEE